MALAIDVGSTPLVATQPTNTVATVTTASFTPPAGSTLLVLWACDENTGGIAAPTITDSLGTPLTYTLTDWQSKADAPTVGGQAAAWTATVATSAAMTVTVTTGSVSGQRNAALKVLVLTGAHATPVGAHGKAGSASASSIAQNYTAQASGGWGFIADCDFDTLGVQTAGTGCTVESSATVGGISYGFMRRTSADDVNGGGNTLNVTLPGTSANLAWVYVEIVPAAGGAAQPDAVSYRPTFVVIGGKLRRLRQIARAYRPGYVAPPAFATWLVDAALDGTGTLTAGVDQTKVIAATLAGTGTLSASVVQTEVAAATLAGTGALTAAVVQTQVATAATLAGTGTLTAAASRALIATGVTLAGTGTLTAAVVQTEIATTTLAGTGTLTADATTGVAPKLIDATLAGTGTLLAAITQTKVAAASLSGTGTLTAVIVQTKVAQATLAGTGTLLASVILAARAAAVLAGVGALAAGADAAAAYTPARIGLDGGLATIGSIDGSSSGSSLDGATGITGQLDTRSADTGGLDGQAAVAGNLG